MLSASLIDWTARTPGGLTGLGEDLWTQTSRGTTLDTPARPAGIPAGRWRRMSRFARLTALVIHELVERNPELPWATLPMVQGSALGEVVPSSAFLDRLFTEGPANASPTNFQNSVYNSTGAHLSLVFGMQGPAETVSAGMATGLMALSRGMEWTRTHPAVLVVVGDDVNPTTTKSYVEVGQPCGESIVAALIKPGGELVVEDGPGDALFARGTALPYEIGFTPRPGKRPEAAIGLCAANGLLTLLATGRSVLDQDGPLQVRAHRP